MAEKIPIAVQINDKNRNYILGGILFAIFFVYYFVIMQPQLMTLRSLSPEITILSQDLKKAKDDIEKLHVYQSQVNQLQQKISLLGERIKSKEEVPVILERISNLANQYHIRVDQITPMLDTQELLMKGKEGNYFSLPIMIEARSNYHDFGRFLNDIESDSISLTVEKFSILANAQDTLKHEIKLTVNAVVLEPAGE
ncbi:MAG: hypothetical protein A2787_06625 [Omnitrophica WOR_2 bacterium RIFCSPHIGHO2_01_FULL_48_9]|nr:MAG: hypothetical protein A3D10_05480 [Omnitrophica WOR_2 bacterium RIFCSPHIGHO2_02_FULL_48_11]OGX30452.1 MAG: hypothetical protein A2787_06625 [Omnitrophica WOR_2 bacterium RIFCSPHIGHO2_01_FULL_48_9]